MRNLIIKLVIVFVAMSGPVDPVLSQTSEEYEGAWTTSYQDDSGRNVKVVAIVEDGYIAQSYYTEDPSGFIQTIGGPVKIEDNTITMTVHFSSSGNPQVGAEIISRFTKDGDQVTMQDNGTVWKRLDNGTETSLASAWFITGRKRDGELRQNSELGPRRTMKILSGTRFQWIAFNMQTGDFRGTGGGTYTAKDGTYVENIEFFSRDNSRVGAVLNFVFEIKSEEWHHSGLSSKGSPIYEIWSPVEKVTFSTDN